MNDSETAIYQRLYRELFAGRSCKQIAGMLTEEHVPTPASGEKPGRRPPKGSWNWAMVSRLLQHPSAKGEVTWNGISIPGCPPIVTDLEWDKARALVESGNSRVGRPPLATMEALLRGNASCLYCGSHIWVARGGYKERLTPYYVCSRFRSANIDRERNCRRWMPVEEVDLQVKRYVRELLREKDLLSRSVNSARDVKAELQQARRELKELDKREENLARLLSKGLSSKTNEKLLAEVGAERRLVEERIRELERFKANEQERLANEEQLAKELEALRKDVEGDDFATWKRLVQLVCRELLREPFKLGLGPTGPLLVIGRNVNESLPKEPRRWDELARKLRK